jgi:hypothetical protein
MTVNRGMQIASGISVLFTTLAFGHIMVHDTQHLMSHHDANQFFIVAHTILAIVLALLSLTGGFYLLMGKTPRQDPNRRSA